MNKKSYPKGHYLKTSESVGAGHPDKLSDRLSNEILSEFLAQDPESHCAIETFITTGQVIIAGEVTSEAYVDIPSIVRKTINEVGYTKPEYGFSGDSCGVLTSIHEQSPDINRGVNRGDYLSQGAGDQGLMVCYSTNETDNFMPLALDVSHKIVKELEVIRFTEPTLMPYLRPDCKSQTTVEYDENNKPVHIDTIVVSTSHDEFDEDDVMLKRIREDVINIVIPRVIAQYPKKIQKLFDDNITYFVNPTGKFVICGANSDTSMSGRKIIVDSTGGYAPHGGGSQNGKDSTKTDMSGFVYSRYVSKNCVAAGIADRMMIEVSYAIGVAEPTSLYVNTYGTNHTKYLDSEIAEKLLELFDFRPGAIIHNLKLKQPMYSECSAYGWIGRKNEIVNKEFKNKNGEMFTMPVELFTWEKLDKVDILKEAFGLN